MFSIPTIHFDRANHYFWGTVAAMIGRLASPFIGSGPRESAVMAALVVGFFRECWNLAHNGRFSLADWAWTTGGAVPVAAV